MKAIVRGFGEWQYAILLEKPDGEFGHGWFLSEKGINDPNRAEEVARAFNEDLEVYVQKRIQEARLDRISNGMVMMAHEKITRIKGKDYAPDVHELQAKINELINTEKS